MDDWYALTRQEAAALVALYRGYRATGRYIPMDAVQVCNDLETWLTEAETDSVNLGAPAVGTQDSGVDLGDC